MEKLPAGATTISGQSAQSLKLLPEPGLMQGRVFECATATSNPSHAGSAGIAGASAGLGGATTATCVSFGARVGFVCAAGACASWGFPRLCRLAR